jgi:hypothetical protein
MHRGRRTPALLFSGISLSFRDLITAVAGICPRPGVVYPLQVLIVCRANGSLIEGLYRPGATPRDVHTKNSTNPPLL